MLCIGFQSWCRQILGSANITPVTMDHRALLLHRLCITPQPNGSLTDVQKKKAAIHPQCSCMFTSMSSLLQGLRYTESPTRQRYNNQEKCYWSKNQVGNTSDEYKRGEVKAKIQKSRQGHQLETRN